MESQKGDSLKKWLIVALVVLFVLGGGLLFVLLPDKGQNPESRISGPRTTEDLSKIDMPPSHPSGLPVPSNPDDDNAGTIILPPGITPGFFGDDDPDEADSVAAQIGQLLSNDEKEYPSPFSAPDPSPTPSPASTQRATGNTDPTE